MNEIRKIHNAEPDPFHDPFHTVKVNNKIVSNWFSSALPWTMGRIGVKIKGDLTLEAPVSGGGCKWKFDGDVTAKPDFFDFDQKKRSGVTGGFDIGIFILNATQRNFTKRFWIKPVGSVAVTAGGRCK